MVVHPDKNNNSEESTIEFQKLGAAMHEIQKSHEAPSSHCPCGRDHDDDDHDEDDEDYEDSGAFFASVSAILDVGAIADFRCPASCSSRCSPAAEAEEEEDDLRSCSRVKASLAECPALDRIRFHSIAEITSHRRSRAMRFGLERRRNGWSRRSLRS